MKILYNSIMGTAWVFAKLLAFSTNKNRRHSKLTRWAAGQQKVLGQVKEAFSKCDPRPVVWLHASSLGEYGVARPIVEELCRQKKWRIVVTFFSPTGYEALAACHPHIDHVFYLPLDTPRLVNAFLNTVRPQKAIFIISEYWPNYLNGLWLRAIPTYLVSAVVRGNEPFFHCWGGLYKQALRAFTHFLVLTPASAERLAKLGFTNSTVTGDPLFDNAIRVARTPYHNPIVERFAAGRKVFIAGSTSDHKDLELVCTLANQHRDTGFIIVPHEISEESLNGIMARIKEPTRLYSECGETTDFRHTQVLIIDFIGALASLYRYATWAYVGGGFTPRLHSIIEATVYGVPVAFGPKTGRNASALEITRLGIGQCVRSAGELDTWFTALKNDPLRCETIRRTALEYVRSNAGATESIMKLIGVQ